jgi:hypothetical protein
MRPVHKLHLYQPNDRFATVVTSGRPTGSVSGDAAGSTLSLWEQPEARGSR